MYNIDSKKGKQTMYQSKRKLNSEHEIIYEQTINVIGKILATRIQ